MEKKDGFIVEDGTVIGMFGQKAKLLRDLADVMAKARRQHSETEDDTRTLDDWIGYIKWQAGKAYEIAAEPGVSFDPLLDIEYRLLKIAGLALHAVDSSRRKRTPQPRKTGMSPAFGAPYKGDTPQPSPDDIYRLMTGYGATSEQAENIANGPDWAAIREGVIANDKMAATSAQITPVTDDMVSRFLGWKLPQDFYPDCHIAFDREKASAHAGSWPSGTNLLHAGQARAMLEHVLAATPASSVADAAGAKLNQVSEFRDEMFAISADMNNSSGTRTTCNIVAVRLSSILDATPASSTADSWAAGADFALNAIALNDLCFVDERMRDAAVMRAADECRAEKRRLLGEPQPQRD